MSLLKKFKELNFGIRIALGITFFTIVASLILSIFLRARFREVIIETPEVTEEVPQAPIPSEVPEYKVGEVLVKFKSDPHISATKTSFPSVNQILGKYQVQAIERVYQGGEEGADLKAELGLDRLYKVVIEVQKEDAVLTLVEGLKQDSNIEFASPNYLTRVERFPNDPLYPQQVQHQLIKSEGGWEESVGSPSIIIAIIDTGVDWRHPDIADNIWSNVDEIPDNGVDDDNNGFVDDVRGWDFVDGDSEPEDSNPYYGGTHGTGVAGVAAATTNNGIGVAGMCWNCKVMPLRVRWDSDVFSAILYAIDNGARVINASITIIVAEELKSVYEYAVQNNIVVVTPAGNEFSSAPACPNNCKDLIAVSGVGDDLSGLMVRYGFWVSVSAPCNAYTLEAGTGGYSRGGGTSYSSPYVAGLVGLILSKKPEMTFYQVKQLIEGTAQPMVSERYQGAGVISVEKALKSIEAYDQPPKITSPAAGAIVGLSVSVSGTTYGDSYTLSYGEGYYPRDWVVVKESEGSADGHIADIDFSNLNEGQYTIRLESESLEGVAIDTVPVLFYRIHPGSPVSFPNEGDIWSPRVPKLKIADLDGDNVLDIVIGNINDNVYAIRHDGSVLPGWPVNASLSWKFPAVMDIDQDGRIEILISTRENAQSEVFVLGSGGTIKNSWRVSPATSKIYDISEPVLADLDKDGTAEVIVTAEEYQKTCVHIFDHQGNPLPNWPQCLDKDSDFYKEYPANVVDLDGDGFPEIVAVSSNSVGAWHKNGSFASGWPVSVPAAPYGSGVGSGIVSGDLDNDGSMEVVVSFYENFGLWHNSYIQVLESDSTFGPRSALIEYIQGIEHLSLGDLDGDNDLEIIATQFAYGSDGGGNKVLAYHHNGEIMQGWPIGIVWHLLSAPAIGNVDGDDYSEVIIVAGDEVLGFNNDGLVVEGYPKKLGVTLGSTETPAINDVDGDGYSELMIPGINQLYIFDTQAQTLNGLEWPEHQHDTQNTGVYTPFAGCVSESLLPGDLDCDCDVDIVDIMMVAVVWNTREGDEKFRPEFDFDGDGRISIADIMYVAAKWHTYCPERAL